jgi:hypothetical protein
MYIFLKSLAWVCCRSIAGTKSSNPAGGIDVYCVSVVFFQLEVPATGRSLVRMSPSEWCVTVCVCVSLSVIKCNYNPIGLR